MKIVIEEERFFRLIRMLTRLSEGDFSNRIPYDGQRDQFHLAEVIANKVVEGFDQIFKHTGHFYPKTNRDFILLLSFYLNKDFKIVDADYSTLNRFGYELKELEGRPLDELLSKESQKQWNVFKSQLSMPITDPPTVLLHFLNAWGLEIPAYCELAELGKFGGGVYRITSSVAFLHEEFVFRKEEEKKARAYETNKDSGSLSVLERPDDLKIVYKVRDDVMEYDKDPHRSMAELAMLHGANEFKLRNDFKEQLGLTPVQLRTRVRFYEAKLRIENSTEPLSEVVRELGFRNYSSFASTFKDLFGYRPKIARKRARSVKK